LAFLIPAIRARFGAKKGKLKASPPARAPPTISPPLDEDSAFSVLGTFVSSTSKEYCEAKAGCASTPTAAVDAAFERKARLPAEDGAKEVVEATSSKKRPTVFILMFCIRVKRELRFVMVGTNY